MNKRQRFFVGLFLIIVAFLIAVPLYRANAQQDASGEDQIPSDLSLDLQLAQQNPAPDQQQIVQSETKQAEIVTTTGAVTAVKPQDIVAPQVKTEPAAEAVHPEQTTSEQVITTPVVVTVTVAPENLDQNQQPSTTPASGSNTNNESPVPSDQSQLTPGSASVTPGVTGTQDNLVPGTTVVSPDDNAAPADNSSNPNLPAPTSPSDNQPTNQPVSSDNSQGTQNNTNNNAGQSVNQQPTTSPSSSDNSQQNTTQVSPPQSNPPANTPPTDNSQTNNPPANSPAPATDNSSNQQQQSQPPVNNPAPATDNSGSQSNPPPPGDNSGSSQSTSSDTPAVQGVVSAQQQNTFRQLIADIKNFLHIR